MLALIGTVPTDWGSYQLLTFSCHNYEASITQLDSFVVDASDVCAINCVNQKTRNDLLDGCHTEETELAASAINCAMEIAQFLTRLPPRVYKPPLRLPPRSRIPTIYARWQT